MFGERESTVVGPLGSSDADQLHAGGARRRPPRSQSSPGNILVGRRWGRIKLTPVELMKKLNDFEQLAEERRRVTSQMMWQVPGLSIAAQAFLYTRAFDPSTSNAARVVVSIAALITALATLQLLLKHRYHEEMYSVALDKSRADREVEPLHALFSDVANGSSEQRFHRWEARKWLRRPVVGLSSVVVWVWVFWAFIAIDVLVIASVGFNWQLF